MTLVCRPRTRVPERRLPSVSPRPYTCPQRTKLVRTCSTITRWRWHLETDPLNRLSSFIHALRFISPQREVGVGKTLLSRSVIDNLIYYCCAFLCYEMNIEVVLRGFRFLFLCGFEALVSACSLRRLFAPLSLFVMISKCWTIFAHATQMARRAGVVVLT